MAHTKPKPTRYTHTRNNTKTRTDHSYPFPPRPRPSILPRPHEKRGTALCPVRGASTDGQLQQQQQQQHQQEQQQPNREGKTIIQRSTGDRHYNLYFDWRNQCPHTRLLPCFVYPPPFPLLNHPMTFHRTALGFFVIQFSYRLISLFFLCCDLFLINFGFFFVCVWVCACVWTRAHVESIISIAITRYGALLVAHRQLVGAARRNFGRTISESIFIWRKRERESETRSETVREMTLADVIFPPLFFLFFFFLLAVLVELRGKELRSYWTLRKSLGMEENQTDKANLWSLSETLLFVLRVRKKRTMKWEEFWRDQVDLGRFSKFSAPFLIGSFEVRSQSAVSREQSRFCWPIRDGDRERNIFIFKKINPKSPMDPTSALSNYDRHPWS